MSTGDRRIYGSAEALIELYRLRPGRITGTGKDGAVTKGDVESYLRGEQDQAPPSAPYDALPGRPGPRQRRDRRADPGIPRGVEHAR